MSTEAGLSVQAPAALQRGSLEHSVRTLPSLQSLVVAMSAAGEVKDRMKEKERQKKGEEEEEEGERGRGELEQVLGVLNLKAANCSPHPQHRTEAFPPSLLPRGYCLDKTRTLFFFFFSFLFSSSSPFPSFPLSLFPIPLVLRLLSSPTLEILLRKTQLHGGLDVDYSIHTPD